MIRVIPALQYLRTHFGVTGWMRSGQVDGLNNSKSRPNPNPNQSFINRIKKLLPEPYMKKRSFFYIYVYIYIFFQDDDNEKGNVKIAFMQSLWHAGEVQLVSGETRALTFRSA